MHTNTHMLAESASGSLSSLAECQTNETERERRCVEGKDRRKQSKSVVQRTLTL